MSISMADSNKEISTPCLKHTVSNLAEKSNDISPGVSLCSNCSETMLSYISLIQDVLDNLAKSIYGRKDSQCCLQCMRQDIQSESSINKPSDKSVNETEKEAKDDSVLKEQVSHAVSQEISKGGDEVSNMVQNKPKKTSSRRNSRRLSREIKTLDKIPTAPIEIINGNQDWKMNFLYNFSHSPAAITFVPTVKSDQFRKAVTIQGSTDTFGGEPRKETANINGEANCGTFLNSHSEKADKELILLEEEVVLPVGFVETPSALEESNRSCEDNKTSFDKNCNESGDFVYMNGFDSFSETEISDREDIHPITTEKSCEAFVSQKEDIHVDLPTIHHTSFQSLPEAFVTICRNNSEALGCLVLGSSLLLCRSSKVLCVLVFEGVYEKFCELFKSIFHVVERVSSLTPVESQPHSRIFRNPLEILNIWRLTQFSKCVYLNSDTLVLRNCDELLDFAELSAVPDNGWPDCFNSGVFVFVPSLSTFSTMNKIYGKREYGEGGEQMFLNLYFNTWVNDLSKKLPFIYNLNLIGSATYTYAAAFQRFGQNVKIVQFSGSVKPWDIKFCSETNQIADSSFIPNTSLRFVHEWINIFRVSVTRLLSMDAYCLMFTQKTISAQEIVSSFCVAERFDCSTFKTYWNEKPLTVSALNNFSRYPSKSSNSFPEAIRTINTADNEVNEKLPYLSKNISDEKIELSFGNEDFNNGSPPMNENAFPISSLSDDSPMTCQDNYDVMRIWEQGKMDYEGIHNSEAIIKRLQLMIQ